MQTQESKIDMSKEVDDDLVVTESSGTESEVQDDSNESGNDTYANDADIRTIYDEEPMAEVQLTAEWQHGQILNEPSNKGKIKKEIGVLETMNIELEHSVAKLRKENETLKKHYKDLYDSIKITRSKTIEQTTSLLANNADLKAQIQKKEVNSRAKIQSHKTRNSNKLVDQKSHTQKPGRQIFTRHRFSPNTNFAVYEKTSPIFDLRWKPTGRIFKSVGLRWIPTRKFFDSCTNKVDSEPPHGLNVDIPNIHECKQNLDVSSSTSISVQKEQSLDLSAGTLCNVNKENLRVNAAGLRLMLLAKDDTVAEVMKKLL
nr:hypothetical protein [Tanacetum cinerariifolium]